MERFLQYLDDLDDLYGMVGLIKERMRRVISTLFAYLILLCGAAAGMFLAILHPPIAMATAILLFVTQLYRSVTAPHAGTTT